MRRGVRRGASRGCGGAGVPAALWLLLPGFLLAAAHAAHWTHSAELDRNYSVFWTPGEEDITFEVQVRTLGYVGFGFSADGKMKGADMIIGWVRDGQVFFQVSAIRSHYMFSFTARKLYCMYNIVF